MYRCLTISLYSQSIFHKWINSLRKWDPRLSLEIGNRLPQKQACFPVCGKYNNSLNIWFNWSRPKLLCWHSFWVTIMRPKKTAIRPHFDSYWHCVQKRSPLIHFNETAQKRTQGCLAKKVKAGSSLAVTQCNCIQSGKVPRWPVKYMQDHIPGRLLCNKNSVNPLFTSWMLIKWLSLW